MGRRWVVALACCLSPQLLDVASYVSTGKPLFRTQHGIPRDKYFRAAVPREPISHLPIIVEIENREIRVFAWLKAAFAILEIQSAGRIHRGRGNGFRRGHLH